jgi:hypothetical protein
MLTEGKEVMAIARWVTKDGMDPKMGVLCPVMFDKVDCLLWAQVCMELYARGKVTEGHIDAFCGRCEEVYVC